MTQPRPSRLSLLSYALMAFPLAFAGLPVYVHTPDFYATHVGLGIGTIGAILLAMRFIDAVQDPIIGFFSDIYYAHRTAMIGLGALLMSAGFWMIYHPVPGLSVAWWLAVSVFICTTGFSIVTINFQAAGGLWQVNEHERTRITSWREAVGLGGLLCASVVPFYLSGAYGAALGFKIVAALVLFFTLVGFLSYAYWTKNTPVSKPDLTQKTVRMRDLFTGAGTRRFFAVYALSMLASSIPAVLVIFFIRDHLNAESMTGLFLLTYFISGAAGMPLWPYLARRVGKKSAWGQSMVLAVGTFIWALFLQPGDVFAFGFVCALSGLAFGADLALPPAIIADKIAVASHQNAAARYYALLAFLSKAALAIATGGTLIILEWAGYTPGKPDSGSALVVMYALVPCVIKAFAAFILFQYNKKGAMHDVSYHVFYRGGGGPPHA
jgi:GPH family glycoside/pentoside/hexuronide:cation symporter